MTPFITTLACAFLLITASLLAIGAFYFLFKRKIIFRSCGSNPTTSKDRECGTARKCDLCDPTQPKSKPHPSDEEDS